MQLFTGRDIPDLPIILAGIRNPYDREISLYRYWARHEETARQLYGALWSGFEEFTERQSTLDRNLTNFYQLDGAIPANLHLLRTESLADDLQRALSGIALAQDHPVPFLNVADNKAVSGAYTPRSEQAVYRRYRMLFDLNLYPRLEP